ncbi:unnamed protein product, partial [Medioppia subpectinata]
MLMLYEKGKNATLTKHVQSINDTLNIYHNLKHSAEYLLIPNDEIRVKYKAIEFFSAITVALGLVLDATGRPLESGFLEGVESNFGDYTECLDTESPQTPWLTPIRGQYCMLKVILPFPPMNSSNIDRDKILPAFSMLLDYHGLHQLATQRVFFPITRIPLEVGPECQIKGERKPLSAYQQLAILLLIAITITVAFSTGYEWVLLRDRKYHDSKQEQLLTSFSLIRNTGVLFEKSTKFACLDTFRLLWIVNVHAAHMYQYAGSLGQLSFKKVLSDVMHKEFADNKYIFSRNDIILDGLFTLSGFLLSLSILNALRKPNSAFKYWSFILQRYLRFVALMFGAIPFFILYGLTGDGPIWHTGVKWVTPGCENSDNLLKMAMLIHNFRHDIKDMHQIADSKCNPPSWFISALMQLTLISTPFVLIYHRNRRIGLLTVIMAIGAGVIASIGPYLLYNIRPYLQIWDLDTVVYSLSRSYNWYHFMPNNYITSYFVGIAFGYLMHRKSLIIHQYITFMCWLLALVAIPSSGVWLDLFCVLYWTGSLKLQIFEHLAIDLIYVIILSYIYHILIESPLANIITLIFKPIAQTIIPVIKNQWAGSYDYIVVGSGSAGAVIASRLTENPGVTVLLLEAGGPQNTVSDMPGLTPALVGTEVDWQYTTVPQTRIGQAYTGR